MFSIVLQFLQAQKPRCLLPVSDNINNIKHRTCQCRCQLDRHRKAAFSTALSHPSRWISGDGFTAISPLSQIHLGQKQYPPVINQGWLMLQNHHIFDDLSIKTCIFGELQRFSSQASWSRNPGLVGHHRSAWTFQHVGPSWPCHMDIDIYGPWSLHESGAKKFDHLQTSQDYLQELSSGFGE